MKRTSPLSLVSSDHSVSAIQRLESVALICDDTSYLSEVVAVALLSERDAVRQYVIDHTDGQRPGDFLAASVAPTWAKDMMLSLDMVMEPIDALERLHDLLDEGLTHSQANMIATQIAIEFDWSATQHAENIGRWALECENYYFANYAHIRRVVEG